jgi:cytochrome c5
MFVKMKNKFFVLLALTVVVLSCDYNSEEELYPTASCAVGTNVSYVNQIKPILDNSCMTCHSKATQNGGVNLEGHAQVKTYVTNGRFIGSIKHLDGFSGMPIGDKLSDCNILKIEKWIAEGALNN